MMTPPAGAPVPAAAILAPGLSLTDRLRFLREYSFQRKFTGLNHTWRRAGLVWTDWESAPETHSSGAALRPCTSQ
jgi:hypothetical protein